ncbi:MAG: serine/threonine-protein kinase [Gemmatimonadetes bacterium]|nr:serine/threonine-protein kinase [Gemmatimonadota bacterium]
MSDVPERLTSALADRYRIERELGAGGMATVYLAEDLRHHRPVAIKVLRPDLAATLGPDRFIREIEIAARLQHPNILPVHDSGEAGGFLYYVMPFVEGRSLREQLSGHGELAVSEAVRILRDVADALAHAHAHGVLHRDIKPENIMLTGRHALVADFGVAKAVSEATGRQRLTTVGVALGTPTYMAPEQAAADPHMDHRADIYAFGVTAYELLAGRPPFTGITPQAVLAAHLTEAPAPVRGIRPTLPQPLAQLVMRCLEKKPADRPQSADELLQVLESLATPSGGVTPAYTQPVSAAVPGRRRRMAVAAGGALTLVAIVAALYAARALLQRPPNLAVSDMVAVTTEPGVEFQPAISPNGQEVAFVSGGTRAPHLVIRSTSQTTGGGEVRLQGDPQHTELLPSWNAIGDLVRFARCPVGGPLSVSLGLVGCSQNEMGKLGGTVRSVGLPQRALAAPQVSWSPDGARLAFAIRDTIFVAAAGDTAARRVALHATGYVHLHSLAWSPDGEQIAYVNGNQGWLVSGNVAPSSLWVVAARGGEPRLVTGDDHLTVSPAWLDARHLLFVSNRDGARSVYLAEVGPEGARGTPRVVPGIADPHSISYSADARKLAWAKFTIRQNIRAYPLDRAAALSIADGKALTSGSQVIEWHEVSPDGRWLAFDSNRRGDMDLYRMPIEGGEAIAITSMPGDQFHPEWSPDGTELAFYMQDPACAQGVSETEVMLVGAQGGVPRALTCSPGYDFYPYWSPDGRTIAFTSLRTGRMEIWAMSRDGTGAWGPAVQLTDFGALGLEWLPDGRGVIGVKLDLAGVFVVALDKRVLWERDSDAAYGLHGQGSARPSRDGRTIYFGGVHRDGRAGIWAMPVGGGAGRLVIAFDDPSLAALGGGFISVGPDRLYLTVSEFESDIWVANLRY